MQESASEWAKGASGKSCVKPH